MTKDYCLCFGNLKIIVLILLLDYSSYTFGRPCMLAKWCLCRRCTSHVGPLASIYGEYLTKVDKYKYMFWLATFNLLIITIPITNTLVLQFMTTICEYSQIAIKSFSHNLVKTIWQHLVCVETIHMSSSHWIWAIVESKTYVIIFLGG